jgi:hypothetical protein
MVLFRLPRAKIVSDILQSRTPSYPVTNTTLHMKDVHTHRVVIYKFKKNKLMNVVDIRISVGKD